MFARPSRSARSLPRSQISVKAGAWNLAVNTWRIQEQTREVPLMQERLWREGGRFVSGAAHLWHHLVLLHLGGCPVEG